MPVRVEPIGKVPYAFGLTWLDGGHASAREDLRAAYKTFGATRPIKATRFVVMEAAGSRVVGIGLPETKLRGAVYSYAATLATVAPDGIYIAQVDRESKLWLCVIHGGLVAAATDVVDEAPVILELAARYQKNLGITADHVFATRDVQFPGGTAPFDPVGAIAKARPVKLRPYTNYAPVYGITFAALLVVGALYGYAVLRQQAVAKARASDAAAQRAAQLNNYLASVRGTLEGYPGDPAWAVRTWRRVSHQAPMFFSGWTLRSVQCTTSGCAATYGLDGKAPVYTLSAFGQHFGAANVKFNQGKRLVTLRLPVSAGAPPGPQAFMHDPPAQPMATQDWVGLAFANIDGLDKLPVPTGLNLAMLHGGLGLGLPPLINEAVVLDGSSPLGVGLGSATRWGLAGGWRITGFKVQLSAQSGGQGAGHDTWTIDMATFHG